MNRIILKKLHCPYCACSLEISRQILSGSDEISRALVACDCSTYPIIEGILVLKTFNPDTMHRALLALKSDLSAPEALFYLLEPKISFTDRLINAARRRNLFFSATLKKIRTHILASSWKKITNADSFTDALTALQLGGYGDYLKYRFFSASFIAGLALISAMRGFPGDILEIGCGTGQAAFVMKQLYPQRNIFLADGSFINLYLAKRFMVSDGAFVCLDADDPLPFRDGAFKAIFSQDVLHYLSSKYLLLREAGRVCSDDGVIFLSHLHNRLGKDTVLGSALSAQGWMRLADSLPYGLFAEPQILEDFLAGDKLDLTQKISAGENHSANAFTLAISKRQDFFNVYENIGESFFRIQNHLTFNPFYKKHKKKSGILFKRQWPTAFYEMENSALDKLLPGCVELDKELIAEIAGGKVSADNQDKILSLMRQFIVYNSGQRY